MKLAIYRYKWRYSKVWCIGMIFPRLVHWGTYGAQSLCWLWRENLRMRMYGLSMVAVSPQGLSMSTVPISRAKHFNHHHHGWFGWHTWFTPEGERRCKPTHNRSILVGVAVLNCGKGREILCLEFSRARISSLWLLQVTRGDFFLPINYQPSHPGFIC